MDKPDPKHALIRIAFIISVAELLIMYLIDDISADWSNHTRAVIDTLFLALISLPFIHFWVLSPFNKAHDQAITEANEKAFLDPLTKLPNRLLLTKHMEKFIAGTRRHEIYGSVLLIDIDDFKIVNDTCGHEAGDAVLVEIANRMLSITRPEDVISRIGGDEFVVLIGRLDVDRQTAKNKVKKITEKLKVAIKKEITYGKNNFRISVSIGIRLLDSDNLKVETAIRDADEAMYKAKEKGKDEVVFFN